VSHDSDHISPIRLLHFLSDSAPFEEAETISEHVLSCPECSQLSQSLSTILIPVWERAKEDISSAATKDDLVRFFRGERDPIQRLKVIKNLVERGESAIQSVSPDEIETHRSASFVHLLGGVLRSCQPDSQVISEFLSNWDWRSIGQTPPVEGFAGLLPRTVAQASTEEEFTAAAEIPVHNKDFSIRFAQLGNKGAVAVSTDREDLANSLVLLELFEGKELKHRYVLLLEKGKAEHQFPSSQWETIRPLSEGLTICVKVVTNPDVLRTCQSEACLCFLDSLTRHSDPKVRKQVVGILSLMPGKASDRLIEGLAEDSDPEIREAAQTLRAIRRETP